MNQRGWLALSLQTFVQMTVSFQLEWLKKYNLGKENRKRNKQNYCNHIHKWKKVKNICTW
jgi:hypothetical protein